MWLDQFLIIFSFCFGINFGNEYNSTVAFKSGNNSTNSRNFNIDRIVGGKPINMLRVPYQIALYNDNYFICGGSIISADWVLTAAHCVYDGGNFSVRAGSRYIESYGQIRFASNVVINSKYNPNTSNHDIALIRVRKPFKWTARVRPVFLVKPGTKLPLKYLVSGWGSQKEDSEEITYRLRGVIVQKVPRGRCRAFYKNVGPITMNMICAAAPKKDSCQGDSGGPLTFNRVQYGVVSFGIGCANGKYPGVYTDIRREYLWIRNSIRQYGGKMPQMM